MRLTIASKGILLVAVPLIFECVFVAVLVAALQDAENSLARELRCQASTRQITLFFRQILSSAANVCFLSIHPDPKVNPQESLAAIDKALADLSNWIDKTDEEQLRSFSKVESASREMVKCIEMVSSTDLPRLFTQAQQGTALMSDIDETLVRLDHSVRLLNLVLAKEDLEQEGLQSNLHDLQVILLSALAFSLVITILLALSFARSISTRLEMLAENTRRVSHNQEPLPLLSGNDELSQLDLVIHKMSVQLKSAEEQRLRLSSMVRAKLQQPLSDAKNMFSSLLEDKESGLSPSGNVWIKKSAAHLQRLLVLINDLSDIDQIESGKIELHMGRVTSAEIMCKSVESVQHLAEAKGLKLSSSGDDLHFYADGDRITQVLINFLANAIKFSPLNTELKMSVLNLGKEVEFRVKDEGPGIPRELQSKIFERYEQTSRMDATEKGGTGLGLNICSLIARAHHGSLGVESEPGKGSCFWVRLPKEADSRAVSREIHSPEKTQEKTGRFAFKIWHKGLVVVAVPLILQISFVMVLNSMLENANRQVQLGRHGMLLGAAANDFFRTSLTLATSSIGYRLITNRPEHTMAVYVNGVRASLAGIERLYILESFNPAGKQIVSEIMSWVNRVLLSTARLALDRKTEGGISISDVSQLRNRCIAVQRSLDGLAESIGKLLENEKGILRQTETDRRITTNSIEILITGALLLSLVLCLLLGAFVSKNISKRVAILIENTLRFTENKELLPVLSGRDELSSFDENFRLMAKKIEASHEFKRHLLALVSHELRTPLTSIFGSLTLLVQGVHGSLSEKAEKAIWRAYKDIACVIELVNDLLEIERMEAGKFPMEILPVLLDNVLDETLSDKGRIHKIALEKCMVGPVYVSADKDLLKKAISKIIDCLSEDLPDTAALPVTVMLENDNVKIAMSDPVGRLKSLPDIDKIELSQAFGNNDGEESAFSLSLVLSKKIIDQMGAKLSIFQDDAGKYSFLVVLPIVQPANGAAPYNS